MAIIYERSGLPVAGKEELKRNELTYNTKLLPVRQYKTRYLIKEQSCFYSVASNQIAYFYAHERQVYLKTKKGVVYKMTERMEDIEQSVDPYRFFRVNRSMIVSFESVKEILYLANGKLSLITTPTFDHSMYVSKERTAAFKKWLDT